MAVTAEQIKARLKVKYPKANLSQKRLDELSAKLAPKPIDGATEEEIDAVLEIANDFNPFEEIARTDDRMRTLEANQKPKPTDPPAPAPQNPPTPPAPAPDDAPAWAKALIKQNETIAAELEALKTGKVIETKRSAATQAFEKSEILKALKEDVRPNWINRINVESETSIEDQITALETEYTTMAQSFADSIGYSGPTPAAGSSALKVDEKMVEDIVNQM